MYLKVKVLPKSPKTELVDTMADGTLKIRVAAPPEKGKANQQLIKFLAGRLDIKNNAVSIISGQTNPVKNIQALGISKQTLLNKLDLEALR